MLLSAFATLLLLPFASAGVHKLKLHKIPQVTPGHALETAYLAEKYGATVSPQQLPLMGAGGAGRNIRPAPEDELYWTQEDLSDGHKVPLTSMSSFVESDSPPQYYHRLHECPVLHGSRYWESPSDFQGHP